MRRRVRKGGGSQAAVLLTDQLVNTRMLVQRGWVQAWHQSGGGGARHHTTRSWCACPSQRPRGAHAPKLPSAACTYKYVPDMRYAIKRSASGTWKVAWLLGGPGFEGWGVPRAWPAAATLPTLPLLNSSRACESSGLLLFSAARGTRSDTAPPAGPLHTRAVHAAHNSAQAAVRVPSPKSARAHRLPGLILGWANQRPGAGATWPPHSRPDTRQPLLPDLVPGPWPRSWPGVLRAGLPRGALITHASRASSGRPGRRPCCRRLLRQLRAASARHSRRAACWGAA